MAGSTALNLSLLSRGIGQVQTNGHEKVEVILEPEDYHNYVHGTKRLFFPPLQARYPIITEHQTDEASVPSFPSPRELHEVLLPKTFTTRKGALLLFSEDMALKAQGRVQQRYEDVMRDNLEKSLSLNYRELHTVDDLTRSILSYGSKDPATETVHMKFVHNQRFWERNHERQMQPGFSAKRYLATWTKVWDDTVLSKLVNKGYISERNLVQYNIVGPNTRIRLSDDLSHIPMPYRLMRNMLICPGSISGYTFYRTVTDFNALDNVVEMEKHELAIELMNRLKSDSEVSTLGSIRVMSTKNGQTEDVLYSSLEKEDQAEVLTDLLVKSAISHALKQQQEFFDRKVADPSESKDISSNASVSLHGLTGHGIAVGELHAADRTVNRTATPPLPEFNMMDAVQTLLETSEAPHIIDGDLSLNSLARSKPSHSIHTNMSGMLRGKTVPSHSARLYEAPKGRPFGNTVPLDGHFPVLPDRPMELPPMSQTTSPPASHRSVEPSSKKITQSTEQLSPVSKRGSLPDSTHESMETVTMPPSIVGSAYPVLPSIMANTSVGDGGDQPSVNVEPPTPQHSILTELPQIPRQTITKGLHSGSRKSKRVLSARKSARGHGEDEAGLKDQSRHSDEKRGSLQSLISIGGDSVFGGEFMGGASSRYNSMESLNQGSPGASHPAGMMKPAWKGSGQSLKSNASKRSPAQSIASATQIKGSVIIGPGGEIIHVGGSVGPRYDVTVAETTIPQDQIKTAEVLKSAFEDEERDRRAISAQQKADELKRMAQKKERELHSGDIDATMSMHGWSYQPLDVLELPRSPSVRSLPNLHKDYETMTSQSGEHGVDFSEAKLARAEPDLILIPPEQSQIKYAYSEYHMSNDIIVSSSYLEPIPELSPVESIPESTPMESIPKSYSHELIPEASHVESVSQSSTIKSFPESSAIKSFPESSAINSIPESPLKSIPESSPKSVPESSLFASIPGFSSIKSITESSPKSGPHSSSDTSIQEYSSIKSIPESFTKSLLECVDTRPCDNVTHFSVRSGSSRCRVVAGLPGGYEYDSEDLSSDESDSLHAKSISEQELINAITEHAHNIATGVLDRSGAGHDLTSDIEKAVTAWMIQHPPRPITRSRTAMDDCVISEVMAAQKQIKSASPSMGEYRELLKTKLTTALSGSNLNTADTDLPEDIIDDLTNKTVSPDDLELVIDEETGRILIQSKTPSPIQTLQVKEGHIYYTPQKGAAGQPSADNAESAKHLGPQISIPTETQPDLSELNIISYSTAELTPTETDQPLVMDAVATESPAPASVKSRTSGASLHDKDIITAPEESPSIAEIKTTPEPEPSTKVLEPEPVVAEPEPPAKAALVQKPDAVENQGADGLQSAVSGKSVGSVVFTSKSPPPASQPEKAKAVVNGIKETKEVVKVAEVIPVEPTQALDKRSADGQSVASMGSDQSKKNGAESPKKEPEKSKSPTKSKSKLGERDEFVVGMPKSKGELKDLYGAEETPAPKEEHKAPVVPKAKTKKSVKPKSSGVTGKKDGKKGKKKKRKGVEENTMDSASSPEETVSSSASPVKEEVKVEPLPEVIAPSPVPSDKSLSQKSDRTEEEEEEDEGPDFIFVRDEFSPVMDEPEPPRSLMSSKSTAPSVGTTDTLETDESTSTGGSPDLHMISNKEARAAKRAAQAEKRRQEVERRRRERDELTKKEKSEAERQEQMRKDMEEEQRRREEEHRLRKQRERDERERDEADEDELERRQQLELERDMRMKDEFQRKLEEMKRKQQEEERKRQELQSERDREEEERRLEEEKMMSEMAEQERIEYEKQKAEEAAARRIQEELERIRLEEESRRAMEEAQRMVEEMARKQAEFERRLRFNRTLQLRNQGLEHSHGMSRAFVFSYYEFLQWLGIEISDLDFHKLVEKY